MTPKQIISILQSQVEAAEEENNKLRDALKEIAADVCDNKYTKIARAALAKQ